MRVRLWYLSVCACAAFLALGRTGAVGGLLLAGEPWRYNVEDRRSGYTYL